MVVWYRCRSPREQKWHLLHWYWVMHETIGQSRRSGVTRHRNHSNPKVSVTRFLHRHLRLLSFQLPPVSGVSVQDSLSSKKRCVGSNLCHRGLWLGDRVPGTARSQGRSAPSSWRTELSFRCVSKGPRRTPCEYRKLAHRPGAHQPTPGGCVQSQTWASPGHTRDWLWHTGHTAGANGLRGVSPGEQKQILVIIRPPPVRGWGQHPPGAYILCPVCLPTSDVVPGPCSRLAAFRTVTTDRTRVKDARRQGGPPLALSASTFPPSCRRAPHLPVQ